VKYESLTLYILFAELPNLSSLRTAI